MGNCSQKTVIWRRLIVSPKSPRDIQIVGEKRHERGSFNGVLAASAMHWVSADIAYQKAAALLTERSHLILLWNLVLQPDETGNRRLSPVCRSRVPTIGFDCRSQKVDRSITHAAAV